MKTLDISHLKPGLRVSVPIVDEAGAILLQKGTVLTDEDIQGLKAKGYTYLYVREPADDLAVQSEDEVRAETRARGIKALRQAYEAVKERVDKLRGQMSKDVREVLASESVGPLVSGHGPMSDLPKVVDAILDDVLTRSTVAGLVSIRSTDSGQYDHGVEVCAVAIIIGRAVGLEPSRLRQLATGALVHDIGKLFAEPTDDPVLANKRHTELGYELLKNTEDSDILAPFAAYEHHEHQDGAGQPRGLVGSNTIRRVRSTGKPTPTLIGEIVAVANRYDNLRHGQGGHGPLPPDQVLGVLAKEAGAKLNREVVSKFLKVVPIFPLGSTVVVSRGRYQGYVGVVTRVAPENLNAPVVTLARNPSGRKIKFIQIDLAEHPEIQIQSVGA